MLYVHCNSNAMGGKLKGCQDRGASEDTGERACCFWANVRDAIVIIPEAMEASRSSLEYRAGHTSGAFMELCRGEANEKESRKQVEDDRMEVWACLSGASPAR
jgi:hypothetical protein